MAKILEKSIGNPWGHTRETGSQQYCRERQNHNSQHKLRITQVLPNQVVVVVVVVMVVVMVVVVVVEMVMMVVAVVVVVVVVAVVSRNYYS